MTRDPSGYPDGPNNQIYCHNNPINHIDPLGLSENDEKKQEELKKEIEAANKSYAKRTKDGTRKKVDILKHNAKKGYDSPTDAALDATEYGWKDAKDTQKEFAGRLYRDPETGRYHFTVPKEGTLGASDPGQVPTGTEDAGAYHFHPAKKGDRRYTPEQFSRGNSQYPADIDLINADSDALEGNKKAASSRIYMVDAKTGQMRVHASGVHGKYDQKGSEIRKFDTKNKASEEAMPFKWGINQERKFVKDFDVGRTGKIYPEYRNRPGTNKPEINKPFYYIKKPSVYVQSGEDKGRIKYNK